MFESNLIYMPNTLLKEQRCECGRLLLKGIFLQASLEIKCKKCGKINKIGKIKKNDDSVCYVLVFDEFGNIVNADEAASVVLGYDHEELIGMHFTDIDGSVTKEMANKLMPPQSILADDHNIQVESFNKTKDGKNIAVNVFLQLYKPTNNERFVVASVSIDDVVGSCGAKGDKKLFIENSCDFYFDIDKSGLARHISQSVETLFGINPRTALGSSYLDFLPAHKREEATQRFNYFAARSEPYRILDNLGLDVNGKITHTDLFFAPNISQDGQFIGYRVSGWLRK